MANTHLRAFRAKSAMFNAQFWCALNSVLRSKEQSRFLALKLCSDAGFETEISNVSTAAQQLDIFSRVFLSGVDRLLRAFRIGENTRDFKAALDELIRVVSDERSANRRSCNRP